MSEMDPYHRFMAQEASNRAPVCSCAAGDRLPCVVHQPLHTTEALDGSVCTECYAVNDEVPFTGHCWSCGERL